VAEALSGTMMTDLQFKISEAIKHHRPGDTLGAVELALLLGTRVVVVGLRFFAHDVCRHRRTVNKKAWRERKD
jgi:hypothetical protein